MAAGANHVTVAAQHQDLMMSNAPAMSILRQIMLAIYSISHQFHCFLNENLR